MTRRDQILIPCASDWEEKLMARARELDVIGMTYGQPDPCHHLCSAQRESQRRGFLQVRIAENMFGYCVRDTMNDGRGVIFGGRARPGTTKAEAIAFAHTWHAEDPNNREVLKAYEDLRQDDGPGTNSVRGPVPGSDEQGDAIAMFRGEV